MGKIKKIFIFLAIVLIALLIFFLSTSDYSDPRYKIFFSHKSKPLFDLLAGKLPEEYSEQYDEKIIEKNEAYTLVNIVDKNSSIYSNDIIFVENGDDYVVKGYPPALVNNQTNHDLNWGEHIAELINVKNFNRYINNFENISKEEIKMKFCYMISNPEDTSSYRIIKDNTDLFEFISSLNISESDKEYLVSQGYSVINKDSVDLPPDYFYCWFQNHGLVKFMFEFEKNTNSVLNVKSEVVGYLGNEALSCC